MHLFKRCHLQSNIDHQNQRLSDKKTCGFSHQSVVKTTNIRVDNVPHKRLTTSSSVIFAHFRIIISFSLGFDELHYSYQASDGIYSASAGGEGGWDHFLACLAGEEAFSTSCSPNATASICTELKNMLESSKDALKIEAMKRR